MQRTCWNGVELVKERNGDSQHREIENVQHRRHLSEGIAGEDDKAGVAEGHSRRDNNKMFNTLLAVMNCLKHKK